MTLEQLKASAYDCLANINVWNRKLEEINKQIANYKEPEKEVKKEEK